MQIIFSTEQLVKKNTHSEVLIMFKYDYDFHHLLVLLVRPFSKPLLFFLVTKVFVAVWQGVQLPVVEQGLLPVAPWKLLGPDPVFVSMFK